MMSLKEIRRKKYRRKKCKFEAMKKNCFLSMIYIEELFKMHIKPCNQEYMRVNKNK